MSLLSVCLGTAQLQALWETRYRRTCGHAVFLRVQQCTAVSSLWQSGLSLCKAILLVQSSRSLLTKVAFACQYFFPVFSIHRSTYFGLLSTLCVGLVLFRDKIERIKAYNVTSESISFVKRKRVCFCVYSNAILEMFELAFKKQSNNNTVTSECISVCQICSFVQKTNKKTIKYIKGTILFHRVIINYSMAWSVFLFFIISFCPGPVYIIPVFHIKQ